LKKFSKSGEQASAFPKKEKKKRKRPLTHEEKEYIVDHIKKKIETNKRLLDHLMSSGIEEWSEEEIRQQERDLCEHLETIENDGYILCRMCGIRIEKIKLRKDIKKYFF